MIGLMASGPWSAAAASAFIDHAIHVGSSSTMSSKTQESTNVTGCGTAPPISRRRSFTTQQRHQLIGRHALDALGCGAAAEPPDKAAATCLGAFHPHDPELPGVLDHVELVAFVQVILCP